MDGEVPSSLVCEMAHLSLTFQLLCPGLGKQSHKITRLTYNCAHLRSTKESLTFEYDIRWYWVSMGRCWLVLGGTGSVKGGTG